MPRWFSHAEKKTSRFWPDARSKAACRSCQAAYRRLGAVGARPEIAQRRLLVGGQGQRIAQPAQTHFAGRSRRFVLLESVVRHEGSEPFRPVAAGVIDIHTIAPPVVQHLVAQRCLADERQADHRLAQIGERGHAEAGGQRAGDDRKLAVGVIADLPAVALNVAPGIVQISLGQAGRGIQFGRKVGAQVEGRRAIARYGFFAHHPGAGHQVDAVGGREEFEGRPISVARRGRQGFGHPPAGHHGALVAGQRELYAIADHRLRLGIPGAASGQETPLRRTHGRHPLQHTPVITLTIQRRQTPGVLEPNPLTRLVQPDAPLPQTGRARQRFGLQNTAPR